MVTKARRTSARPLPLTDRQRRIQRLIKLPLFAVLHLLSWLGQARVRRLAAHPRTAQVVTWMIRKLLGRQRLYCEHNFEQILGERSPDERQRIERMFYQNMLGAVAEGISLPPASPDPKHIRSSGLQHLDDHPNGVIFVSCHLYGWEISRLNLFRMGIPVYSLYRDFSDRLLNHRSFNSANRFGDPQFYIPTWDTKRMIQHIANGDNAFLFVDVRNKRGRNGKLLDFCGKPAWTSTFAASMALAHNKPLIPVYILQDKNGDYHQWFEQPIDTSSGDPVVITQLINDSMSRQIMANPHCWALWDNNRWAP